MGGPTCVCDTGVGVKHLGHVDTGVVNELTELGDLSHLFECKDLISLVTIDRQSSRIVTSIF